MNMARIKSFFISRPEAPTLPTHTQRSLTQTSMMERIKSFFISRPEAPTLPTHTQRSLTQTSMMERIKSFFISRPEAPTLPTHTQRSLTLTRSSSSIFQEQDMGKAILNLAFSATIALVVLLFKQGSLMTEVDPPFSLCILGIAILIAFSASFLAISLRRSCFSRAAEVSEHIGIVSTVVAFFMLMSFLLQTSNFQWLVLAACVVSLLGYVIAHVEGFCVTDAGAEGG